MIRIGVTCVVLALTACSKKAPPDVRAVVDAQHDAALKVADDAIVACPPMRVRAPFQPNPMDAPVPMNERPGKGTSLELEPNVMDVFVMCSWPDPRDAAGATWAGTALPALKGGHPKMVRPVTMPEDIASDTCKKNESSCERLVVPSRYSESAKSADLRIVRPTKDGGRAEVTIVFVVP